MGMRGLRVGSVAQGMKPMTPSTQTSSARGQSQITRNLSLYNQVIEIKQDILKFVQEEVQTFSNLIKDSQFWANSNNNNFQNWTEI